MNLSIRQKPSQRIESNWYVLLTGLPKGKNSHSLADGIALRPLEEKLSIFDLAIAGASGFQTWAVLEPFCSSCTAELESAQDAASTPGYDALNRAWLATALLVLRGFTGVWAVACNTYSWNRIAGYEEQTRPGFQRRLADNGLEEASAARALPTFRGRLLDYHFSCFLAHESKTEPFDEADANWVRERFDSFNVLASKSVAFRLALESAVDWRFAKEPRSAVARLWAGIEALLAIKAEQVYRISSYAAALLADRGKARKEKFDSVKRLYGLRSKIVHGEQMQTEVILRAMSASFNLLKDLILLSVDRGSVLTQVDFDAALFG